MLSNMKFDLKTKIIGIASSFALPIMVLGYFVVSNINTDIEFSTLERKGNEYQRPLEAILQGVVDHQMAVIGHSEGKNVDAQLASSAETVRKGFEQLAEADSAYGVDLQFTDEGLKKRGRANKNVSSLKSNWAKLLQEVNKLPASSVVPADLLKGYEELVADVRSMITHMGDTSNLILDPDLDSYYMMDVTLLALPQTQDRLGKIATLVNELSKKSELSQDDRIALSVSASSLEDDDIKRVTGSLETSFNEDPNFYNVNPTLKRVKPILSQYVTANMAVVAWLKDRAREKTVKWSEFEPLYQKARAQSFDLWNVAVEELNAFLDTRVSYYENQRLLALLGSAIALLLACVLSYFVFRSITGPVSHLVNVMKQIAQGESNVRANITTTDEVGTMARQFDLMVEQREALNTNIQRENETLNNSIIEMLQAVGGLAQKDLTIKAPVTEDITGPLGDALNYLTFETVKVLNKVVQIAGDVSNVSKQVKTQSDNVIGIAADERREVEQSATELSEASVAMLEIAKLALSCNQAASKAIQNTEKAQETVLGTIQGITSIRDTIRETEKRIKRLGERSQEIGSVVTIINSIAERTHILALNASMHAASAGEAGRGFAVVANEVQKLAENAREATQQISGLVNNIQVETADTVTTMNDAITQVVQGTNLAQQAGNEMRETRDTTAELVQLVKRIADSSKTQAETSERLKERSEQIQKASEQTYNQLQEQGKQTDRLVGFSGNLVESVGVFKLPAIG
jgi:twitching motility protein PilJ